MTHPKYSYGTIEEFQREEVRDDFKVGFSVADLYSEASSDRPMHDFDDDVAELDFG